MKAITSKPRKEPQAPAEASADASPRTPGQALRRWRLSLLRTSWPWRSLVYLLATPVTLVYLLLGTLLTLVYLLLLATPLTPTPVYVRAMPLVFVAGAFICWPVVALAAVPLGRVERARLGWIDLNEIENPHQPLRHATPREWLRVRLRERATWTEVLHVTLLFPLGLVNLTVLFAFFYPFMMIVVPVVLLGTLLVEGNLNEFAQAMGTSPEAFELSVPFQAGLFAAGLLLLVAGLYAVTLLAEGERYIARYLLGRDERERLGRELAGVTTSRARIAAAFDEARSRIERDLHDGAQQRLTSVVMTLATTRYQLTKGEDVTPLVDQATAEARQAIDELRDLVHGIYPAALREHDLTGVLREAAERSGIPANLDLKLAGPLPNEVEVGVYFAVSELLTNVTKHSGATSLSLTVRQHGGFLVVTLADDGIGGASTSRGTGLLGVADRIETLGGTLDIDSPEGGPTTIRIEVPCASS
jgi:signal transduction histidine kinase